MASQVIPLPEKLESKKPETWKAWIERFEFYRVASELHKKDDVVQVSTLIYAMGGNAHEISKSFHLNEEEATFEKVVKCFNDHFIGKTNLIFERAKFNRRYQLENESVIDFIEDLNKLAETCNYGDLKDELIRDKIVVGIHNKALSEKLMNDESLTLDKAIKKVKASELIKEQQQMLKGDGEDAKVAAIQKKKQNSHRRYKPNTEEKKRDFQGSEPDSSDKKCYRCGRSPLHRRHDCPAKSNKCYNCQKIGHYASVCKGKSISAVEQGSDSDSETEVFLGEVRSKNNTDSKWHVDLHIGDTSVTFKLDTGADVTVIPEAVYNNAKLKPLSKSNRKLFGPGHSPLSVKGVVKTQLKMASGNTTTTEIYVIEGLKEPLLGRPAIDALHLVERVNEVKERDITAEVQKQYPKLFQGLGELKGEFHIELDENAKPFALYAPRRVALPLMSKVKKEIERMENLGVISKVDQPTDWCAGMVVVPKKDGNVRICVDLTKLNESVKRETHPLPKIDNLLSEVNGSTIFSKVDANSGFWQEKLAEDSRLLTTFITPFGRYCFNRMPFGVKSAPEHYQKKISQELEGISGAISLLDDILIHGKDQVEHDDQLHTVLRKLNEAQITLNKDKCEFSKHEIKFAGYIINGDGIKSDPDKTEAVKQMETPQNVGEVRRFLGMVNQLGKFIPHLANKTKPLRELLSKKNEFIWGAAQQRAFDELKEELSSTPILTHYDPNKHTILSADASSYGLGAVLLQVENDGTRKPLAYASRSMTNTEQRYAQIEKEALATTWACEKFSDYILGKDITIETDHKPLVPLLGSKNLDELPPRIQRFRMRLMKYSYNIVHIPGKELYTADTLSRAPLDKPLSEADQQLNKDLSLYVLSILDNLPATEKQLENIRLHQDEDEICRKLKQFCAEGWPEKHHVVSPIAPYWQEKAHITVQHGLLMKDSRLLIPSSMRLEILDKIHTGHLGIRKCRERARESVWWPGLNKQIEDMVTTCATCCRERKQNAEPMMSLPLPDRPWQKVATDLFYLNGKEYVLLVDYFSRYLEIAPLKNSTSQEVINHLKSFFARHGIPEMVFSDNGPQYSAAEFSKFAEEWGFTHLTSSPRYPQSNGEAERAVKTVKSMLKKCKDPYLALLTYRSTPIHNGYSPAELLFGRKVRSTLPLTPDKLNPKWPVLTDILQKESCYKLKATETYNKTHRAKELPQLHQGENVWVTDLKTDATVTRKAEEPRSYIIKTEKSLLRRNRRQLVASPNEETAEQPQQPTTPTPVVTRSGREVKPPERLNL